MANATYSIVIATCGDPGWAELARDRALPSVVAQNADELVMIHGTDASVSEARNEAAARATMTNLIFLDADDELAPGYVTAFRLAHAALGSILIDGRPWRPPVPELLVPRVQYVHTDGREQPPEFPNRHAPIGILNHAVIGTCVPRDLFLTVGGFPEIPIYEDYALWLKCVRAGAKLVDIGGAIYRAFLRDDSRNQGDARVAYDTYWQIRNEHEVEMRKRGG